MFSVCKCFVWSRLSPEQVCKKPEPGFQHCYSGSNNRNQNFNMQFQFRFNRNQNSSLKFQFRSAGNFTENSTKSHLGGLNSTILYCQAQPQSQLSWAELALVLIPPAARPSTQPPGLVVNKQEISSTCFVTSVGMIQ